MREIKFRAWHHGGGDPRVKGAMTYSRPFPVLFWKQIEDEEFAVELMQYTGLKDKNGKEIYEGDIVKFVHEYQEGMWDEYTSEVIYDSEVAGFVFGKELLSPLDRINKLEILGNIYKNPEFY